MSTLNNGNSNESETPNDVTVESPVKRKRGRPRKTEIVEKPSDGDTPVLKKKRGRPKGSKNKNPKPKPVITSPPRPRGRPRKWPPPDTSQPKRGRGRPRKNAESQVPALPIMVAEANVTPITHDAVPPNELLAGDELGS